MQGINAGLTFFGGERDLPIDYKESKLNEDVIFKLDKPFEIQNPGYMNIDMTFTYCLNHKRMSSDGHFK